MPGFSKEMSLYKETQALKTRYQAGLQCLKHLWLLCHAPELADPVDEVRLSLFRTGHRVGELARNRFPGGVLVEADHRQSAAALRLTAGLLRGDAGCIYEAAFSFEGVLVRPDIMVRRGDAWDIIEVKSSTDLKPEHVTDAAIQTHVVRGAGARIDRVFLLHLNRDYVFPGGDYDLDSLFVQRDITADVAAHLALVPSNLTSMRNVVAGSCPQIPVGRHCSVPYTCAFYAFCRQDLPEYPVSEIPQISDEALERLRDEGIHSITDVPPTHSGLTPAQHRSCAAVRSGVPHFDPELATALSPLRSPLHFLDFETLQPALPFFPGTRPYQTLPFLWSCHSVIGEGAVRRLEHRAYLHRPPGDPRRPFVESLVAELPGQGPIVVYTTYEDHLLEVLASDLPDMAPALTAIRNRLFDLHAVIRKHVQHPEFHGSTSLKRVLPALVPDLSYEDLAIRDGAVAAARYEAVLNGNLSHEAQETILKDLYAYCATDTLALVRLTEVLGAAVARA